MGPAASTETLPPEALLSAYPDDIAELADRLRAVVHGATPEAVERVRAGWRLIGYDLPVGRRHRYFAYVAPEPEHVHLGFEYGAWVEDPAGILQGAHLRLRRVRYVTYRPGDAVPRSTLQALTREAARVALFTPQERVALELDRAGRRESAQR